MKSRKLAVKTDFPLKPVHLKSWAADLADSVIPYFAAQNTTPLLVAGKSVKERHLRAIRRAFRRRRERVAFARTVSMARTVAFDFKVERTACSNCGETAKVLHSRLAFLSSGKVVEFAGKPRYTPGVCPACGSATKSPTPELSIMQQLQEF